MEETGSSRELGQGYGASPEGGLSLNTSGAAQLRVE